VLVAVLTAALAGASATSAAHSSRGRRQAESGEFVMGGKACLDGILVVLNFYVYYLLFVIGLLLFFLLAWISVPIF
jgi:hypothetical protein